MKPVSSSKASNSLKTLILASRLFIIFIKWSCYAPIFDSISLPLQIETIITFNAKNNIQHGGMMNKFKTSLLEVYTGE